SSGPGGNRHRRRGPNSRTPVGPPFNRGSDRTILVLDRPGQQFAQPEPGAESSASVALRRTGRRDAAGPFFRRGDRLLFGLRGLFAPAGKLAGPGGPARFAPRPGRASPRRASPG